MRIKKKFISTLLGVIFVIMCMVFQAVIIIKATKHFGYFKTIISSVLLVYSEFVFFVCMTDTDGTCEQYIRKIAEHIFDFDDENTADVNEMKQKTIEQQENSKPIDPFKEAAKNNGWSSVPIAYVPLDKPTENNETGWRMYNPMVLYK